MIGAYFTQYWPYALLVLLVVTAAVLYTIWKKRQWYDITIPMPDTRRDDLLFGYYGSLTGDYDKTKGHTNLFWYSNFFGLDEFIQVLLKTSQKIVFDLNPFVATNADAGKRMKMFNPDAENNLRAVFNKLRDAGVLHKITYLYPMDEPTMFCVSPEENLKMIMATKKVAAEFSELANAKLAVIYGHSSDWWHIGEYDVVGVDYYKQKSEVLTRGEHARLVKSLAPHQRTFLLPGCAYGQIPDPFVAYALSHPDEVEGIIPFLWFQNSEHDEGGTMKGLEAQPEEFRNQWIKAARICMNVPY